MSSKVMERIHGQGTGWFAAPNAVFHRPEIGPYAKLVYLYLCRRGGPDGCAWPSLATIAHDCGVSKDTIVKAIKTLEAEGCIRVQRVEGEQLGHVSNRYHFLPMPLAAVSGPLTASADTPLSESADTLAATAVTKDYQEKDDKDEKDTPPLPPSGGSGDERPKKDWSAFVTAWNEILPHPPFPRLRYDGNDGLRKALCARLKSPGWQTNYIAALQKAAAAPAGCWLKGGNDSGWVMNPAFFLQDGAKKGCSVDRILAGEMQAAASSGSAPNKTLSQLESGMALAKKFEEMGL